MRAPPRHARPREPVPAWAGWAAVALLTGASLGLGFYDLTTRSLWLDESYSWVVSVQKWSVLVDLARGQGWHLLPYYVMLHGVIAVFGDSPTALRAPSVIAGAVSVPFMYLLATRVGGRLAAVSACLLFVVSEPLVFWQQNARDYTFVVLFGLIGTWAGVVATQTARPWAFVTWVVFMAGGSYTHPEMFLLVPVQIGIFVLWAPSNRTRVKFLALVAVGAVFLLPALENAKDSGVYKGTFLVTPNHDSATEIASFLASAASSVGSVTPANHALLGITFLLVVVGVAMLGSDLTDRGSRMENLGLALGLSWTVLPMLFDWLVSETGRQAFVDRYLIVSLPGVALLVAQVAERIKPRALALFAIGYITVFHAGLLIQSYPDQLDDYRDATKMILTDARPGDCVTFQADAGRILYDYYEARFTTGHSSRYFSPPQVLPTVTNQTLVGLLIYGTLPDGVVYEAQAPVAVKAVAAACSRIFVLESHFGTPTGPPSSTYRYSQLLHLTTDLRAYYKTQSAKEFPGGDFVQVFERVALPS